MALYLRMALYYLFASLSGAGWLEWDATDKTVLINVDDMSVALAGAIGFVATYLAGRWAKRRGGAT